MCALPSDISLNQTAAELSRSVDPSLFLIPSSIPISFANFDV